MSDNLDHPMTDPSVGNARTEAEIALYKHVCSLTAKVHALKAERACASGIPPGGLGTSVANENATICTSSSLQLKQPPTYEGMHENQACKSWIETMREYLEF
jgi:hypothetical protein